ncbi:MAG TPA: hypothetical protein VIJ17_01720 [Pseudolabrys sp.]
MRRPPAENRKILPRARRLALLLIAACALAGCETDGSGPGPFAGLGAPQAEAAKPEPPMTRTRAASECWMKTEKGQAGNDLDKRADAVAKCIDDKMKTAAAAPKT